MPADPVIMIRLCENAACPGNRSGDQFYRIETRATLDISMHIIKKWEVFVCVQCGNEVIVHD